MRVLDMFGKALSERQHTAPYIASLISLRDAALLREAGDRAVAWCEEWAEVPWSQVTKDRLRAAIMATEEGEK